VLEETLDKSRGNIVHVIEAPEYAMGIQVHGSKEGGSYNNNVIIIIRLL